MFTYVKAKNFKSLKNIEFNIKKTENEVNNLVVIYGENGSGKTNIAETFRFLQQSILQRSNENVFKELMDMHDKAHDKASEKTHEILGNIIGANNIRMKLSDYRTINEEEMTELEYGFIINGIKGIYSIKFNDKIQEEKLYYLIEKQRGYLFEIRQKDEEIDVELNKNIFINSKYAEELKDSIKKYWGRYSFLAILNLEMMEKNAKYIFDSISNKLIEVIIEFISCWVHLDIGANNIKLIDENFYIKSHIENLGKDEIEPEHKEELEKYEKILKIFFTQAYADIKDVRYKIIEEKESILYELIFDKKIGNKIRSVPYHNESEGTKRIVEQFNTLIKALNGETVIIDEIDNGIHDLLIKNIIMSMKDEITGQLIITTHNTLLLETLPKESIYILTSDYEGNKQITSLRNYENKVQKNNNARDLYLKGAFGGIPLSDYIDFETIKYILNESKGNDI